MKPPIFFKPHMSYPLLCAYTDLSQARFWCWRAQSYASPSWTAWVLSSTIRTRFGGTLTPLRTRTDHGSASWWTSHRRHPRTPLERDIWLWCAPRGRPKSSWCLPSLASLSTISQSRPLYCGPMWYLCVTASAWPASVPMDTSWPSGMTTRCLKSLLFKVQAQSFVHHQQDAFICLGSDPCSANAF